MIEYGPKTFLLINRSPNPAVEIRIRKKSEIQNIFCGKFRGPEQIKKNYGRKRTQKTQRTLYFRAFSAFFCGYEFILPAVGTWPSGSIAGQTTVRVNFELLSDFGFRNC